MGRGDYCFFFLSSTLVTLPPTSQNHGFKDLSNAGTRGSRRGRGTGKLLLVPDSVLHELGGI